MKRAIITVLGKDKVGIIAKTCVYLAEKEVNVLEISQTIVEGFFNMIMIVDITNTTCDYGPLHNRSLHFCIYIMMRDEV